VWAIAGTWAMPPRGRLLWLVRIAHPAQRDAVLLHHGLQHFHARSDGELQQLGAGIDQEINERQVTSGRDKGDLARGDDWCKTFVSWRLLL